MSMWPFLICSAYTWYILLHEEAIHHGKLQCVTVNILKIRELYLQFKSNLLKFRKQYDLLAVFLRKLVPTCKIEAFSAAMFRKALYRKWPPLALSLSQYRALQGGVEPQYWRSVRAHQGWTWNYRRDSLALAKIRGFPKLERRPINQIFRVSRGKIAGSLQTCRFFIFRIFTVSLDNASVYTFTPHNTLCRMGLLFA